MSNSVLIIGSSGTGKSTAIRTLPSEECFIINVLDKPLPFRGYAKEYTALSADGMSGNYYATDDFSAVKRVINLVNNKRLDIRYLILDDAGFLIMNDYIKNALIKGFDKYSVLAKQFSEVIASIRNLRNDLFCFVMMHVENDIDGKTKVKTIGKMIDNSVCIEGQFTYVFHTIVHDKKYKFITNNDGIHLCKTPMGCFDEQYIDNNLMYVVERINAYNNEDIKD